MYTKIYYWILMTLTLLGFSVAANEWFTSGEISTFEIINNVSSVIFFVGVTGYVWGKAIFNELFWKVFFIVDMGVSLWFLYVSSAIHDTTASSIGLIIGILFTIPALFFLYSYAFNSHKIWDKNPTK